MEFYEGYLFNPVCLIDSKFLGLLGAITHKPEEVLKVAVIPNGHHKSRINNPIWQDGGHKVSLQDQKGQRNKANRKRDKSALPPSV